MKEAKKNQSDLRWERDSTTLMALKLEGGHTTSQGMREASGSWKGQGNRLSLKALALLTPWFWISKTHFGFLNCGTKR
jgi:hypothetical protein